MEPINPYSHKRVEPPKPKQPPVVTATKAGLHPLSKLVQGILGHNRKKGS